MCSYMVLICPYILHVRYLALRYIIQGPIASYRQVKVSLKKPRKSI
jgi:hypothetical protein